MGVEHVLSGDDGYCPVLYFDSEVRHVMRWFNEFTLGLSDDNKPDTQAAVDAFVVIKSAV